MSFTCSRPRIAVQDQDGEKPKFLKVSSFSDYEFYSRHYADKKLLLIPCGTCPNCVKKKSQEWTARLLKESENHNFTYFITLTYNDENLKDLNKRDLQLFLKRYRKKFGLKLKYYITGEYGEISSRSHYHCIFFQDKPINDLIFYSNNLYISKSFENCWSLGNCLISKQVNERTVRYTVAYTLKKLGEKKIVLMSKGLGLSFFKDNKELIKQQNGFYSVNGFKHGLPTYFRKKLKESSDIEDLEYLKNLENIPHDSVRLSGHTLKDLFSNYEKSIDSQVLKGKGEF